MNIFQHSRFSIYNKGQHPLNHDLSEFMFASDRLPGVATAADALNYLITIMYPNWKGTFANMAALLAGIPVPTPNDYAVVSDDGDGKSAGYVYTVIDGVSAWTKRYDVDWSFEGILAETVNRTQYMYVHKYGMDDNDAAGPLVGINKGQHIYGGVTTNSHLTLHPNSFNGTGYIQATSHIRPTTDATWDLGTAVLQWRDIYASRKVFVGNLTFQSGSITDGSGTIDFDNEDLTTTGVVNGGSGVFGSTVTIGAGADLVLGAGSITSISGAISFGNEDLSTLGTFSSGTILVSADLTLASGSITSASGSISFGNENLSTTGTLDAGFITGTKLTVDNLQLDANTVYATNAGGDLRLQASLIGTGSSTTDVDWTHLDGMSAVGPILTGVGGNFYAYSDQSSAGDLSLVMRIADAATDAYMALTNFAVVASYLGLKYVMEFYRLGTPEVQLLVAGISVFEDFSAWDETDLFEIRRVAGQIGFFKNNVNMMGATTFASAEVLFPSFRASDTNAQNLSASVTLSAGSPGVILALSPMETIGQTVTGIVAITGSLTVDNFTLDGNTFSTTDTDGDLIFAPDGAGRLVTEATFIPGADGTLDLGLSGTRFQNLFLNAGISDGTNGIAMSDLLALRSTTFRDFARTDPAQAGDTLFWDNVDQVWLASHPDSEIFHDEISNLTAGDAGHTQFVLLAGRAGGQILQGGTAASENITLESTAHATKGYVFTRDTLAPETTAAYAAGWSGTDIGDGTHYFRDVYSKGEFRGMRVENFTAGTLPASSGSSVGRLLYTIDTKKLYVDNGSTLQILSSNGTWVSDTVWNGTDLVINTDVSGTIADARLAIWALHDNANDFERLYVSIKATSISNVRITVETPLDAGNYRLIGLE